MNQFFLLFILKVVGLGNYSLPSTRHSVGMSVLNRLAEDLGIKWTYEKKCSGFVAKYSTDRCQVLLLKPKLAMNINGKSILRTGECFQQQCRALEQIGWTY